MLPLLAATRSQCNSEVILLPRAGSALLTKGFFFFLVLLSQLWFYALPKKEFSPSPVAVGNGCLPQSFRTQSSFGGWKWWHKLFTSGFEGSAWQRLSNMKPRSLKQMSEEGLHSVQDPLARVIRLGSLNKHLHGGSMTIFIGL